MSSVDSRIFPEDPNSKKIRIQKGEPHPLNDDTDATKNPSLRTGFTKTTRVNVDSVLKKMKQPLEPVAEPTDMQINDEIVPKEPDPDCVIPPTDPDDVSPFGGISAERTDVTGTVAPPEVVDVADVSDNNVKPGDDDIFYGTGNEVLALINGMTDELEKEGYSVSVILNSSFLINVLDYAKEGMTKGQVKQIIREELAKMPYDQVCNLTDVVDNVMQAAGVQDLEAETGLSLIALINIVVNKAHKSGSDKEPVTLSGIKQIIDEILFARSQRYKESVYNDDNAELRADTDVKDFIEYVCNNSGYSVNDKIVNDIFSSVIDALTKGEISLLPNKDMIDDVIDILLTDDVPGISIDTVTELIDIMLRGQINGAKSGITYGALKAFILNILDNMFNDCVLPPVEPPIGPSVNPHIGPSTNNTRGENIKMEERNL